MKNRNNSQFENLNSVSKIAIGVGVLLISGFLIYQSYRSVLLAKVKLNIYEQASIDVNALRIKNLELLTESMAISKDYYVEIEGRDRLNLSRPGEYNFIIPKELLESQQLEDYYATFKPTKPVLAKPTGLNGWFEFVINGI